MTVSLTAISFNHDASSAKISALNIRRDLVDPVIVPEWRSGETSRPEDSLAAYAISEAVGHDVSVVAQLVTTAPEAGPYEVRAITPQPEDLPVERLKLFLHPFVSENASQLDYQRAFQQNYQQIQDAVAKGNVLGEVAARSVSPSVGGWSNVPLRLIGHRLFDAGVGIHCQTWLWQYRRNQNLPWRSLALTQHRIYTIIALPTLPWRQGAAVHSPDVLWTRVLDYACLWAQGAQTAKEAAAEITRAVYGLGKGVVQYDCVGAGASHYTTAILGHFNCLGLLDRLGGGIGMGSRVDCSDCATLVSTFANALGCDLWQSGMGMVSPFFEVNPILAIGSDRWQTPCGRPGFYFHEVAWTDSCGANDFVFDACLAVNAPSSVGGLSQSLVPTDMKFGTPGSGDYLDCLATAAGRKLCPPQPSSRLRRLLATVSEQPLAERIGSSLDLLSEHLGFPAAKERVHPKLPLFVVNHTFKGDEFAGWTLLSRYQLPESPSRPILTQYLWSDDSIAGRLLNVNVYECSSESEARDLMVEVLAGFQLPMSTDENEQPIGDMCFKKNGDVVVFARGNLIVVMRAAGRKHINVLPLAQALDNGLSRRPPIRTSDAPVQLVISRPGEPVQLISKNVLSAGWNFEIFADNIEGNKHRGVWFQTTNLGSYILDLYGHDCTGSGFSARRNVKVETPTAL